MNLLTAPQFPIQYVDSPQGMADLLEKIAGCRQVFLDLEADSMHHYFAKICLIQLLADDQCFLIDPLSGISLEGFLQVLAGKELILHGADYDLRMLYQASGFRPLQVFDTMLAAQLLGKTGFGLASLVHAYFGISLRKDQQKADWSIRPLPPGMLEYGAQDTFFLPELHRQLTEELAAKNRLDWHTECCAELVKATARSKEVDLDNTWRIDGSAKLYPRQLAVLKALWIYRDQCAQAADLPSFKILPSDILLRFALCVPPLGEPTQAPALPSRLLPKLKTGFLETFQTALAQPSQLWPQPFRPPKKTGPSPNANLLAHLKAVRDKLAESLELDPSLLATKSTMTAVALSGCTSASKISDAAKWMKWQENLLLNAWLNPQQRKSS